jgi:hypothetical protein
MLEGLTRGQKPEGPLQVERLAKRISSAASSRGASPSGRSYESYRARAIAPSQKHAQKRQKKSLARTALADHTQAVVSCATHEGELDGLHLNGYDASSGSSLSPPPTLSTLAGVDFFLTPEKMASEVASEDKMLVEMNEIESRRVDAPPAEGKKSIAANFQESFYFKRPNWQTDLATSGASSDCDDDDDDDDDEDDEDDDRDDAAGADKGRQEVLPACPLESGTLKTQKLSGPSGCRQLEQPKFDAAVKRKRLRELRNNHNILEELSGFGEQIAHYETSEKCAGGHAKSWLGSAKKSRISKQVVIAESATKSSPECNACHKYPLTTTTTTTTTTTAHGGSKSDWSKLDAVANTANVAAEQAGPAQVSTTVAAKQSRSSFFAYLPLTSSSGQSYSFGTSTTSSLNFDPAQRRTSSILLTRGRSGGGKLAGQSRGGACESLRMDNLKLMVAKNLVATLIGTYILISLFIILGLMLPYLFDPKRSYSSLAHLDQQTTAIVTPTPPPPPQQQQQQQQAQRQQQLQQPKDQPPKQQKFITNLVSKGTQTGEELGEIKSVTDQRDELKKRIESQQKQPDDWPALRNDRKRRVRTRLNQLNPDARGLTGLQESWRKVHPGPCQPLKLPMCSRSIQSMMPPSVTATINSQPNAHVNSFQMSYEKTLLPNQFTFSNQPQIERQLEKYEPLVDVRCYPLMPLFLCSIFAPKCIETRQPATAVPSSAAIEAEQQQRSQGFKFLPDFMGHLFQADKRQANRSSAWQARLVPPCRSVCRGKQLTALAVAVRPAFLERDSSFL